MTRRGIYFASRGLISFRGITRRAENRSALRSALLILLDSIHFILHRVKFFHLPTNRDNKDTIELESANNIVQTRLKIIILRAARRPSSLSQASEVVRGRSGAGGETS